MTQDVNYWRGQLQQARQALETGGIVQASVDGMSVRLETSAELMAYEQRARAELAKAEGGKPRVSTIALRNNW